MPLGVGRSGLWTEIFRFLYCYFMQFESVLGRWGVVTAAELQRSGVSPHRRDQWLAQGSLRRVARGVYTFGPDVPAENAWHQKAAIAVASGGPDAALAGRAAARLWQLDGFDRSTAVEVIVPLRSARRGFHLRRVDSIDASVVIDGLPAVGCAQTILDLGTLPHLGPLRPDELVEAAIESALRRGIFDGRSLLDHFGGADSRRAGSRVARQVVGRRGDGTPATESFLETRGVQVLRNGGLPAFDRQVELYAAGGRWLGRVDLYRQGVVLEFDGRAPHDPWFVRDRRRWTALSAAGYRLAVFTWTDVWDQPATVVERATSLLRQAS